MDISIVIPIVLFLAQIVASPRLVLSLLLGALGLLGLGWLGQTLLPLIPADYAILLSLGATLGAGFTLFLLKGHA